MTNKISEKDKKDWENFLSKNEKLPNKDFKKDIKLSFKTRSIDLHGYTLEEANKSIENFIIKSYQEKINKLVVVTGKGIHSQTEKDPYVSKVIFLSIFISLLGNFSFFKRKFSQSFLSFSEILFVN